MSHSQSAFLLAVAERFLPKVDYVVSPVDWAADRTGTYLWSVQQEILESIRDNRYTVVPSAHDGGKSFVAAVASAWWLDVHPRGEAFVVSTAPSTQQVSVILWREIKRLHKRAGLFGRINMGGVPEWKMDDGETVGYGRKPADYDDTGFQGVHSQYPLIIVDEAAGIPQLLWDAVDALATNDNARVLAIGNPTAGLSNFRKICNPSNALWNRIWLDGLRTPNFTREAVSKYPLLLQYFEDFNIPFSEEDVPDQLRQSLLSVQWVAERMLAWGITRQVDNDGSIHWSSAGLWEAKVRGKFPSDDKDGVIPMSWIEMAIARWYQYNHDIEPKGRRKYAVDVAHLGEDETSIACRTGHVCHWVSRRSKEDTMVTANRMAGHLSYPASTSIVDVTGVGAGVYDRLRELHKSTRPFVAAGKSTRRDSTGQFRFPNVRSEAWWNLRELLDPSAGSILCLPDDEQMIADLTAPRFQYRTGSTIYVESKADTIKRLGHSPDTGDAVVMAFWDSGKDLEGVGTGTVVPYGSRQNDRIRQLEGFVQAWQ